MKSLTSALLGTTALALVALGVATPAQARVGVYVGPYGFGVTVDRYRNYCRDNWYRHRYWSYCRRYYDDDDYGYYRQPYYYNNYYYDNDDDWGGERQDWRPRYNWGGEGEEHERRHHHEGGEGEDE